jgi:hypothetical protein
VEQRQGLAEVDAFMRGCLYNRVTYEEARENCPVLWAEMNAIEDKLRQFSQARCGSADAENSIPATVLATAWLRLDALHTLLSHKCFAF